MMDCLLAGIYDGSFWVEAFPDAAAEPLLEASCNEEWMDDDDVEEAIAIAPRAAAIDIG